MYLWTWERRRGWEELKSSIIGIYSLTCVKRPVSGKLLHNTGCSVQCPVNLEGWDGKVRERLRREGIYVYLQQIHIVVQQKPMQHCRAIIFQLKIHFKKCKKMIHSNTYFYNRKAKRPKGLRTFFFFWLGYSHCLTGL